MIRAFYAIAGVGWLLFLIGASYPKGATVFYLVGFLVLAPCAFVWLIWFVGDFTGKRRSEDGRGVWPFLLFPAAASVVVGLMATGAPLAVRWQLSKGAFEERAHELADRSYDFADGHTEWIGLYEVSDAYGDGRAIFFKVKGSAFLSSGGFARIRGPLPPPGSEERHFSSLGGDWYEYQEPI